MIPSLISRLVLSLLACKNDPKDSGTDDSGTAGELLGFYVYDANDPEGGPVEGITVAVDTTDGERLEAVSNADGFAEFELELERFATAIAHADGWNFVAVTADAVVPYYTPGYALSAFPMWSLATASSLPVNAGGSEVMVSGALNRIGGASAVVVRATTSYNEFYQEDGPTSYELGVPAGQEFSLVAWEFEPDENWGEDRVIDEVLLACAVVDQPALSGPATVDIDFADAVAVQSFEGSVAAPADTILAEQGYLYATVWAGEAYMGFSPSTAPGADGASYDFRIEYVEVAGYTPDTRLWIDGPDGSTSTIWIEGGLPAEGAQDLGLLAPPRRTEPSGSGPFEWGQAISWTPSPDADAMLLYFADIGQIGLVSTGSDDVEFALPELPSTSTSLAAQNFEVFLAVLGDVDGDAYPEIQASDVGFSLNSPFLP